MEIVYVIKLLPADIAMDKDACKYQIHQYEIERETKDFVFVRRYYPRLKSQPADFIKLPKGSLFTYGRYTDEATAVKKIKLLLMQERESLKRSLENLDREFERFETQYGYPT